MRWAAGGTSRSCRPTRRSRMAACATPAQKPLRASPLREPAKLPPLGAPHRDARRKGRPISPRGSWGKILAMQLRRLSSICVAAMVASVSCWAADLIVVIDGVRNAKGDVELTVYDNPKEWPDGKSLVDLKE